MMSGRRSIPSARGDRLLLRNAAPTLVATAAFDIAVVTSGLLAARVFGLAFLLFVPGALLLALAPRQPAQGAARLAYAVAGSVVALMALALALSVILPAVGIQRPLSRLPATLAINAFVVVVGFLAARRVDPIDALLNYSSPRLRRVGLFALLGLLPVGAAIGAELLNNHRMPGVALVVTAACLLTLLGFLLASDRVPARLLAASLFSVALALLWAYSLRSNHVFGFDIQQEYQAFSLTFHAARWQAPSDGNAYRSMLSITALPTLLSTVTGISGTYLLKVAYPALFALFPVLTFEIASRWLPRAASFLAAAYVVVLPQFAGEMVGLAREEVALLLAAALIAVAFDRSLTPRTRKVGAVLAGTGVAVAHYSTAYITCASLIGVWLVYGAIRAVRARGSRGAMPKPVFATGTVLAVVGVTLLWNVGFTKSYSNVINVVDLASTRGIDFLPALKGASPLTRWLGGTSQASISPAYFTSRSNELLRKEAPWINHYPAAATPSVVAASNSDAVVPTLVPGVIQATRPLSTAASQGFLLATVLGLALLTLRRRNLHNPADLELVVLAAGFLVFGAVVRVSGVAALNYSPARAQIHSAVALGVALATACAWALIRWRRLAIAGMALAATAMFASGSGLSTAVGGGNPPANLSNKGTAYERFFMTDQEMAAAAWLGSQSGRQPIIYTDRYGKLRLWGAGVGKGTQVDILTPESLDQGAWVLARSTNVVEGKAEGAFGNAVAVYSFPRAFLDDQKSVVFSTAETVVWK
jgi:uncharacterized membrane protein